MNKTIIFRKIGGIISEITEQYQYLAENPENINPLELELFIANSHFLSEHLAILKKLDSTAELLLEKNPLMETPESRDMVDNKQVPEETVTLPINNNVKATAYQREQVAEIEAPTTEPNKFSRAKSEDLVHEVEDHLQKQPQEAEDNSKVRESSATRSFADLNAPVEQVGMPEKEDIQPEQMVRIATSFSADDKVPTLNEILSAGKTTENIGSQFNRTEGKDLKSMIKLNEKLLFIRDLFNGYTLAYSEAIELANRSDTFEAADKFLKQNYAGKNRWSEKQNTVDQFYEVLNKRFS